MTETDKEKDMTTQLEMTTREAMSVQDVTAEENPTISMVNNSIEGGGTILTVGQEDNTDTPKTCADVIAKVKVLAEDPLNAAKEELDQLKQLFYKLHRTDVAAKREAYIAEGGVPEEFHVDTAEEDEYKALMSGIKEKRAEVQREEERQREENYLRKEAILDRIRAMVDNADKEQASYNDFKALQQEWKVVGEVPASKQTDLWKQYQQLTERFYDILKLNIEFREYDFKKNLEAKTRLCEAAEKLSEETDVISAFHQLQKLHQEFREIGPVAKELREDVWNRFKEASTAVNKRHQQHFEEIREREKENLERKTAICEAIETIEYDALTSYTLWNEKTQVVIAAQEEWKTIGFAPQKMNAKIFERFRAACDEFFLRKGEFFKSMKDNLAINLEKKIALCEQAEALKDCTDWKETSEKLAALQKEWKTLGPVAKKHSDAVWKRFITACDAFFENRKAAGASQRTEEQQNLAKKKEIIAALATISLENITEEDAKRMHELIKEWNTIGHVPYREKDKIYKQYKALIDGLFDALHENEATRKVAQFRSNMKGSANIGREREKLLRAYENMRNEIKTYENNIGFLTSSSKSGNSLVAEMQRKMEKLRADAELVLKKISILEESEE